jgi:Ala-tRNA(Pro) deacylase
MRIDDYLTESRVAFEALAHPPAYTAANRAKVLRVPGKLVAKSVLLHGPGGFFLVVLPATHPVDVDLLSRQLEGRVRLAREEEVTDVFRDCEWGAVPPFGRLYGLPVVLEESVAPETMIVVEGQSHFEAIRLSCRDFEMLESPRRLRFARPPRSKTPPRKEAI